MALTRLKSILEDETESRMDALKQIADTNKTSEIDKISIEPLLAKAILKVHSGMSDPSVKKNIEDGDIATVADTCWLLTKGM